MQRDPQTRGTEGLLAAAQGVLDHHVRGLDGRCSCGARRECPDYEQAQAVMAERHALPRRRPDAARRDLLRRRGGPRPAAA